MLPNKKNATKIDKNEENWQNPNRLMKFSKIWYVDTFYKMKIYHRARFSTFLAFLCQKTAKIDKNEENWQNPNNLMKFSKIWYVDASQQKNC